MKRSTEKMTGCVAIASLVLFFIIARVEGNQNCTVGIKSELTDAIEKLRKDTSPPSPPNNSKGGFDSLFYMLRNNQPATLVILMDTSKSVGLDNFFLINKPVIETLLSFHVDLTEVTVSLITFDGNSVRTQCKKVSNNCPQLIDCVQKLTYSRLNNDWYVHDTILEALDEAQKILQDARSSRKALLILSLFYADTRNDAEIMKTRNLITLNGTEIYTVDSYYHRYNKIGVDLASSRDKNVQVLIFLSAVYGMTANGNKCSRVDGPYISDDRKVCDGQNCMCKLGFVGKDCDKPKQYCMDSNACPANSTCTESSKGLSYNCSCPTCSYKSCLNELDSMPNGPTSQITTVEPGPPIIIIAAVCATGGLIVIVIVVAIVVVVKKRRPGIPMAARRDFTGTSNEAFNEEVDDEDLEDYLEMSQKVRGVTQRGMPGWEPYLQILIQEKNFLGVSIMSNNRDKFCTTPMNFLPITEEMQELDSWFAGSVQRGDRIRYKDRSFKVLSNTNDIIQALSVQHRNQPTRICFARNQNYYIIGLKAKTQMRGDMLICFTEVQTMKNALTTSNDIPTTPDYSTYGSRYDEPNYQ